MGQQFDKIASPVKAFATLNLVVDTPVPTMVFQGEPFFGQDKIELLLWRMQQKGLERLGKTSRTTRS